MTKPFRVVVAPDKFKGSLPAAEVAETVAAVLRQHAPRADIVRHPVADGGEGTVALALSSGFSPAPATVTGPLGDPVTATFAARDGIAVLEMASVAGLALLPGAPDPETAWRATTYGVGELVLAAVEHGAHQVVVGVGGSSTTDGGAGAVAALGVDLARLADTAGLAPRLSGVDLILACDVDNPLIGPDGAAAVYGPQKGADSETVAKLEDRLVRWADAVAVATGRDLRDLPGAGAAGGLAFGLVALARARIVSGVELLLELTGFQKVAAAADLVVVGEGSLDHQSLRGKGPVGVARVAAAHGSTVIAVAGRNQLTEVEWRAAGLSAVYALTDLEPDPAVCMRDARRLLATISQSVASDWIGPGAPG